MPSHLTSQWQVLPILLVLFLPLITHFTQAYAPVDIKLDEKAKQLHRIDSFNILAYTFLLILTLCTIWLFKRRRARFLHETGLAVIYGLIIGAIIRYVGEAETSFSHIAVTPLLSTNHTLEAPPDAVWVPLEVQDKLAKKHNKTYVYVFRGQLAQRESKGTAEHDISQKATFDPEIFFNIILPPIIFNAGYSLKKRFFFRNIGAIMTYAFIGTTISCFAVGVILYGFVWLIPSLGFNFSDCLYFGAITSATDPVTILAIFNDLHVDVTLYALVFGESILNDAVAITLAGAIDTFEQHKGSGDQVKAAGEAITNFVSMFVGSLFLGSLVGCTNALLTKFTRLQDYPLLETCLFVLMSYSTFLMGEVLEFSGIVAVLFCGICQAHYTANNLSDESKTRTKQLFELLNFMAENFIFTYIGVSMFTYPAHKWRFSFILVAFLATFAGRALNIYPLTFLLNLGRQNKIPKNFQHVLCFSGLRGAMAFALALRNTLSEPRQLMLTTTSLIVIVTVVVCGGSTATLLEILNIPVGVDDSEHEMLNIMGIRRSRSQQTPTDLQSPAIAIDGSPLPPRSPYEKAWFFRKWYNFDVRFMKPLLTHSRPTLIDTLPECCLPIAKVLTTTEQLNEDISGSSRKNRGLDHDGGESDDDGDHWWDDGGLVSRHHHQPRYNGTGRTIEAIVSPSNNSTTTAAGIVGDLETTITRPRVGGTGTTSVANNSTNNTSTLLIDHPTLVLPESSSPTPACDANSEPNVTFVDPKSSDPKTTTAERRKISGSTTSTSRRGGGRGSGGPPRGPSPPERF